ncbi:uncharacterized protein BCR38DRAFT_451018 [Pseudomassariella vexata]|uniref:Protein kinase domain-containing protein n=1 Tax=Pseudomassariella vexata TaxID=1141098 RepID=A0A1Y2DAU2_9PEZI|nr:uncharacterized protein BCR38DRAFT_451018 [Pseudomassariella vexata]ORY56317.1 hypothetical protein BCR38DRAFT_451018 [Pseudomassariella vexata]
MASSSGLIKKLKITEPLSTFPFSILDHADTLEQLDVSGTGLSSLPREISRLKKLKIAFFSYCNFTVFPKELASCPALEMVAFRDNGMEDIPEDVLPPRLRWLILTNNALTKLPKSIGKCSRLQKCMLSENQLHDLPEEMMACQKLGLLRLSANRIETLPSWLFQMPELSFLSFADNPCSTASGTSSIPSPSLAQVSWSDLEVQELLGEGASGIISKGIWKVNGQKHDVAVKLFKGDITSDGTPVDEMRACIVAGAHDNLIDPLGKVHDHPNKKGLVMQLIPPNYSTLGLPPSLQTCTRDCFLPSMGLSTYQGLGILMSIAAAAVHLHEKGVSHGDLYAHNILYNEDGHALLGDFGAASIYAGTAYPVERLEVLGFAHLLEDVWGLIKPGFNGTELRAHMQLEALHKRCASTNVIKRPGFHDILAELSGLHTLLSSSHIHRIRNRRPSLVEVRA